MNYPQLFATFSLAGISLALAGVLENRRRRVIERELAELRVAVAALSVKDPNFCDVVAQVRIGQRRQG